MDHWFDQLARGVADRRLSRRQVLITGARAFATGTVAGGGYALFSQRASAQATPCIPPEALQNCVNIAAQTQAAAEAACAAELPANQQACLAQAASRAQFAESQCAKDAQKLNQCGACEYCRPTALGGLCEPMCPVLPCIKCDPHLLPNYPCMDTCPPGQYCSPLANDGNGGCEPLCFQTNCTQYDPSTKGCRDTCNEADPCMECRQDTCMPLCDTGCERCDKGNCIDQCPAGQTCVSGTCSGCPEGRQPCGQTPCCGTAEKCCDGKTCYEPSVSFCCGTGDGVACNAGTYQDQCCSGSQTFGTFCCGATQTCCYLGVTPDCCDPGEMCYPNLGCRFPAEEPAYQESLALSR